MKILIIEDSEYKYNDIKDTLNRVLDAPTINWEKSRNSGLVSIMKHNCKDNTSEPYDMVICDNYMPIYDDEIDMEPSASDIVREIRKRFKLENLPIVICSSAEVEECDCNYKIKYNSSVSMDETFKTILADLSTFKQETAKKLTRNK